MPNISKKSDTKIINTKGVKELITNSASFNKTSDFKKIKNEEFMPRMKCNSILVKKFREEAQNKKWLLTTLMNEILEERYGKIINESESE